MARTLVAISILLAAAASAAAEPPSANATDPEATARANTPAPTDAAAPTAATHSAEPIAAPAAAAAATPPAAPAEPQPTVTADVRKVEMKKLTDDTVCRNERPTGSQIGIRRCYSRSAAQTQNDEIMRRDIEEMRARQNDQQAREAAAAMTRRRAGL